MALVDTANDQTFGQRLIQAAHEALAYKKGELRDVRATRAKVTARGVGVLTCTCMFGSCSACARP